MTVLDWGNLAWKFGILLVLIDTCHVKSDFGE
jgi:hypothetical protein